MSEPSLDQLRERHGERFKWLVLFTVMLGAMASIVSSTIVNVAVPDMSRHFSLGQDRAQWISAGFMAAGTISLLLTPWLLGRFGMRRTYVGACFALMVGGLVGGFSNNFGLMISMRVLEGIAAGVLTPIPNVVVMRAFPPGRQGRAMGIFGFGVVLAPALGPSIGGVLVEQFGWRSIFFVVVPFCIAAILLARRYLPLASSFASPRTNFDMTGLVLAGASTLALLNGVVGLQGDAPGLSWALLLGGLAGLAAFAVHQLRVDAPLLQMRLFLHRPFAMGAIVAFIFGMALFGSTYLLPLYLQTALDYSPSKAGFVLLPGGVALALTILVAGRMADKLAASWLVGGGMLALSASLALTGTVGPATPYLLLVFWVLIGRVGLGLAMPALSLGSVKGLAPGDIPQAASVSNFLRQLGGAVGVALAGLLVEWRLSVRGASILGGDPYQRVAAFDEAFMVFAAICLPAVIAAWFMRPPRSD